MGGWSSYKKMTTVESMLIEWTVVDVSFESVVVCYGPKEVRA